MGNRRKIECLYVGKVIGCICDVDSRFEVIDVREDLNRDCCVWQIKRTASPPHNTFDLGTVYYIVPNHITSKKINEDYLSHFRELEAHEATHVTTVVPKEEMKPTTLKPASAYMKEFGL